jgi:hypothetical protein
MIISKKPSSMFEIDLTGPDGNVFYLLGAAIKLGKELGYNTEEITEEMTSGDYENAVQIFDKYFGDYVIMYR